MTDCVRKGCSEKNLSPVEVADYDGCCSALCAEIVDGLRKDDLIEELQDEIKELEAEQQRLCDLLAQKVIELPSVENLSCFDTTLYRPDDEERIAQELGAAMGSFCATFDAVRAKRVAELEAKLAEVESDLGDAGHDIHGLEAQVAEAQARRKVDREIIDEVIDKNKTMSERIDWLNRKIDQLNRMSDYGNGPVLLEWMEAHKKAVNKVDDAYRRGYLDGSTAVNTVGPDALAHVEMHFNKWREEE